MNRTYSVMIIDDDPDDRFILKRLIAKTNLPTVILEAENGRDGIETLLKPKDVLSKDHPGIDAPLALFLDINMPIMNGWDFLDALEERAADIQLKPTVVLMYSTSDSTYEKEKAGNYSTIQKYIVKGDLNPDELKKVIVDVHN